METPRPTRSTRACATKARTLNIIDSDSDSDAAPIKTTRKRKSSIINLDTTYNDSEEEKPKKRVTKKSKPAIKKEVEDNETKPKKTVARKRKTPIKKEKSEPKPKASKRKSSSQIENDEQPKPKVARKRKTATEEQVDGNVQTFKPSNNTVWNDVDWLAEFNNINPWTAKNIINLFDDDNSIPFIARYRRDLTSNMEAEELRNIKESYELLKSIHKKAETVIKTLETRGVLDNNLKRAVLCAKTLDELEHIYAPYKPGTKKSLAERAIEQGLKDIALAYLYGENMRPVEMEAQAKEISPDEVKDGIINIISHIISHDTRCLENVRKWRLEARDLFLQSTLIKTKTKEKENVEKEIVEKEKYANYFDFKNNVRFVKPYQVLAINRGEHLKVLKVKLIVPERIQKMFEGFCRNSWLTKNVFLRKTLVEEAFKNAYTKYIEPLIVRQTRADLKTEAEKASINVFENNLKNMLMARPCKSRILGIDPGFKHGCKYALITETGNVATTGIFYPKNGNQTDESGQKLSYILEDFNCSIIALGNGTACRETENWITTLKQNQIIPKDVKYTIVNESGASIYSCTSDAKNEFPNMDTNIISAVSIARRLQDPLSELIKIEPKHLGVGMYQHDLKEKVLSESLDEVIVECVSFVGVNLNTASTSLLKRIAGLNVTRANNIIEHRNKIGYFKNRSQIKDVKGVGTKVFEQCAGFLRIAPVGMDTPILFYKSKETNKLDRTWIHPESYDIATKYLKLCNLISNDIGSETCINKITEITKTKGENNLIAELNTTENIFKLIHEVLSKPLDHDLRLELNQAPLFKTGCTKMSDLKSGDVLTGRVQNVTDFGSFVDIGVGRNGLIHQSKTKGVKLKLGDHVEVEILEVDIDRGKIGLALKSLANVIL